MNQLNWQRSIIRDEYITEGDINVRSSEILRVWQGTRLYDVRQYQKRNTREIRKARRIS